MSFRDFDEMLLEELKGKEAARDFLDEALTIYTEDQDPVFLLDALMAAIDANGGIAELGLPEDIWQRLRHSGGEEINAAALSLILHKFNLRLAVAASESASHRHTA